MHTTTPQFVEVCQLLVRKMEGFNDGSLISAKEEVLDQLQEELKDKGLVFDRSLAAELFDKLLDSPDLAREEEVDSLRQQVERGDYFNEGMLDTLGDRILRTIADLI